MPEVQTGFIKDPNQRGPELLVTVGPTLQVQIGFDPNYRPGASPKVELPPTLHPALVDTGATESCIDTTLAVSLKLPVVERGEVAGVGGLMEVDYHLAQIYAPELDFGVMKRFAGVELRVGGGPHLALVGRDFLRHHHLTYDGPSGGVTISRPT